MGNKPSGGDNELEQNFISLSKPMVRPFVPGVEGEGFQGYENLNDRH